MYTYHFLKKKKKVEWNCGNGIAEIGWKKIILQLVCGNAIAEIGGKKIFFWAIVAIPLPKMGRKKKWFLKSGEELKKNGYVYNIFTIFSQ